MGEGYRPHVTVVDRAVVALIRAQKVPVVGRVARLLLLVLGVDCPTFHIGRELLMPHATAGSVIHGQTVIGDRVLLMNGVTVGISDVWNPPVNGFTGRAVIGDDAILGAGCRVLFRRGQELHVGARAIVGANAVVTRDVPDGEIWAGIPAQKVGERDH